MVESRRGANRSRRWGGGFGGDRSESKTMDLRAIRARELGTRFVSDKREREMSLHERWTIDKATRARNERES